jgi:hypothetical protein
MKKTGNKWETKECPRCKESHTNYSGKLNSNGIEYVVCGITNKPMNLPNPHFQLLKPTIKAPLSN